MRIGFDASVSLAPRTGIGRFTLELLRALLRCAHADARFTVLLNSRRHDPGPEHAFLLAAPNAAVVRTRIPGPIIVKGWSTVGMPSFETITGAEVDVVHAPAGYLPPTAAPLVATVHDIAFVRDPPGTLAPLGSAMFLRHWPRALPRAARIATDSDFVRFDLMRWLPDLDAHRISTMHLGADHVAETPTAPGGRHHLLAVTGEEPRKRPDLLLESYARLRTLLGDVPAPPLRVVGLAHGRPHAPGVHFLPRIGEDELRREYAGALATVLASREEGFGLPLLEAMRAGSPVICGRNSSLAEVGAGAARLVASEDAEGFAAAMRAAIAPPPPEEEDALRAHAARFTWDATARGYLGLYRESLTVRP